MPKMKTKSGAKKRFRFTATGKVKVGSSYMRHQMRKKPQSMKRKARGTSIVAAVDTPVIKKHFMPYGG